MKRTHAQHGWDVLRLGALVCVSGFVTLAGCATDQKADVQEYRGISDPPGGDLVLRAGEPLTLVDALRLTALHNEQLAVQGERYVQALALQRQAAAALLPSVDLFADLALRENAGDRGIVQSDAGVAGQYRLLTGLSDLRNVNAAEARVEVARWLILDLRESLLVQTAQAYYQTLRAERLTEVLNSSVRAQAERLADAKARNEVGFTRPLDVSQIESQVSRTRAQLVTAERQAGEARSALKLLTNADVDASALTDGFESAAGERELGEMIELARAHRQDIVAARAEAEAARQLVDAAIGAYAPSLTLNLDYFLIGGPETPDPNLSSLLQLRLPLFSAGRIEAQVREAWSIFRERVLTYRARVREMRSDVETAHLRLRASMRLAAELETQVRVATQAVELAEAAYEAGLGTNLERVVAQDQLLTAELERVSESFVTKTSQLELLRACGLLSSELIGAPLPEPPAMPARSLDAPVLDRDERTGGTVAEPTDEGTTRKPGGGA